MTSYSPFFLLLLFLLLLLLFLLLIDILFDGVQLVVRLGSRPGHNVRPLVPVHNGQWSPRHLGISLVRC